MQTARQSEGHYTNHKTMTENNKAVSLPVDSLSYSGLTQLLRNPLIFKLKYILGVYDSKTSVSGMIGRAGHEALKAYYGGNPDKPVEGEPMGAKQVGLDYLNQYDDAAIDYGKTQSREDMLKGYSQAMDFYFAYEPKYHRLLVVEEKLSAELTTADGQKLPLPASGIPDLVHERADGGVEIIDVKFVKSFTNYDTEDYIKIIQAQFMWHLLKATRGVEADRMLFREVKRTKNADGSPQIRDWEVPFNHEPYRIFFYNLYRDVVRWLASDPVFLPNLSDLYDGEHSGLVYAQGLVSGDMSDVEVMHKVRDVAFTSKKFVASRLDRAENQNLPPEEKVKLRLAEFGMPVEPVDVVQGQAITQYRFKVSAGVRMSSIKKHKDDIARTLEAKGDIRILAPIPGTPYVGIEVERVDRQMIKLGKSHLVPDSLSIPVGVDVSGELVRTDLKDMPHLLIAGATGSGKSNLVKVIIRSLTSQVSKDELNLTLIDPKRVELASFAKLPHLGGKGIIYEYEDSVRRLMALTDEMEARYKLLEASGKSNLEEYNQSRRKADNKMPYLVCIIDEFADLIMQSKIKQKQRPSRDYANWPIARLAKSLDVPPKSMSKYDMIVALEEIDKQDDLNRVDANTELLIVRLAQMGRAAGIHLIIATQRPSVDVITGLIKANFPTRIALTTSSPADSQVIIGERGAEKLIGKGDMIYMHPGLKGRVRLQALIN